MRGRIVVVLGAAGAAPSRCIDQTMLELRREGGASAPPRGLDTPASRTYTYAMRILVVEDDVKTAAFVRKGLSESGFVVDVAYRGDEAVDLARNETYDLLILDIMLPGIDGWQVFDQLRQAGLRIPVIFLTARDRIEERVRGLEAGGDDYIVKPFAFSELLARVRAVLRRGSERQLDSLRIADLEIDVARHKVTRDGKPIDLTAKEFVLLCLLARREGEVLSRALIIEKVWDMNFDSDTNVVDVAVRRLRSKVDDPFPKKLIRTIRGVGYVLEDR